MTNGVVQWPSHAIAEPILRWIGIARPASQAQARALQDALRNNTSANLPTLSSLGFLLDIYMPGQSDLLFALFLIGVFTAVCVLLLLIKFWVLFILCTSRRNAIIKCGKASSTGTEFGGGARAASTAPSSASGVDAFSTDEKPYGRKRCQRVLLSTVCTALWACLVFACVLYACALGELASPSTVGPAAAVAPAAAELSADDDELAQKRFGRDNNYDDAEVELLGKFEDMRELGYQFRALFSPGAPALFLLFFVFIFYLTTLVLTLFATLIGMNRGPPRLYIPSGDHHLMMSATARAASAACSRRARVRRTLACSALAFLCAAPLMLALGSTFLVQAHAHLALCVHEQQTAQDLALRRYVGHNFGTIVPSPAAEADDDDDDADADQQDNIRSATAPITLPDFLSDMKSERVTVNTENCRAELAPINALWLSIMLLALVSVPFCLTVLALLFVAKCWSNADESTVGISLRAYLPGWVQNAALGQSDAAYKSLAPVVGGQYQHYSISSARHGGIQPPATLVTSATASAAAAADASQSSFGTFVYKKY